MNSILMFLFFIQLIILIFVKYFVFLKLLLLKDVLDTPSFFSFKGFLSRTSMHWVSIGWDMESIGLHCKICIMFVLCNPF